MITVVADTMLLEELTRQREAAPPLRDRLSTTLFLVGALHALVILGVSFAPPRSAASRVVSSLEVLLVQDPVAEERLNSSADYLAQVNQRGAGTAADARRAESPRAAAPAEDADGEPDAAGEQAQAGATSGAEDLVATRATAPELQSAHGGPAAPQGAPLFVAASAAATAVADEGDALRLKGPAARELLVTANTRESSVAVYLDHWRSRIERIGTLNYPMQAARRARMSGNPVLEVQILANGQLGSATVQRSSGHAELDQAALGILRLAAPFEPFPAVLAVRHDSLRLAYEWQFMDGELKESTVRMPVDTR